MMTNDISLQSAVPCRVTYSPIPCFCPKFETQHVLLLDLAKRWSLGHLTSLSLAESKSLAEIGLKAIASLPELKLLDLEGCPNLTAVGLKHLSR